MNAFNLLPKKTLYIAKGVNNVFVNKDVTLHHDRWVVSGNMFSYTIIDEKITDESSIFFTSQKEFGGIINNNNVMLLYPEIHNGYAKVYADSIPTYDIVCDYVVFGNMSAVATDKAGELSYEDTNSIGVSNVQEALDYIISRLP